MTNRLGTTLLPLASNEQIVQSPRTGLSGQAAQVRSIKNVAAYRRQCFPKPRRPLHVHRRGCGHQTAAKERALPVPENPDARQAAIKGPTQQTALLRSLKPDARQATIEGPDARRAVSPSAEAYFLYAEHSGTPRNAADGPYSVACLRRGGRRRLVLGHRDSRSSLPALWPSRRRSASSCNTGRPRRWWSPWSPAVARREAR